MIFQLLLTMSLILVIVYAFTQKAKSLPVSSVATLSALAGLYFVWAPNQANDIAQAIGIGRGADLIFYCWGVISLVLLLNLHFKLRSNMELLTVLTRKIAIMEAEQHNRLTVSGWPK
jgi:small membrane protein